MGSKGPTLHEVARRAGVSIATVSRVARGISQVSPDTHARVLEAIDALHYRPSHFGRALVKRSHGTLGIVFPGLRGPYYSEVIHGFETEAIAGGLSLLILGTELRREADEQVLGMADRADGLAIMGGTIDDDLIRRLVDGGTRVVTMARPRLDDIPNIQVDNMTSTVALTGHLIDGHGYDDLAFIGNIVGAPDAAHRWRGFLQAHHDRGMEPPAAPLSAGFDSISGVHVAQTLLERPTLPHALVCGNDELALGVLSEFAAHGVRVPDNIAITGWDDIPFASAVTPSLTTIRQPARALGSVTARTLLALIANEPIEQRDLVLETELVTRASCGCPPASTSDASPATLVSARSP